ncbi:MAG: EpsG family protein, partial [Bacteroidales bacterium]|nr:EpsG family protein [Bacteroidales bacterium]
MIVESVIYSFPYLALILIFLILMIFENNLSLHNSLRGFNLQIVRWFSMGLILVFFGFRGFVGWDWTSYYPAFMSLPKIGGITLDSFTGERFDPGFIVLMSLIKTIWSNYHFFIFVTTLIDIIILGAFLKRFSPSLALSGLVFIIMSGFYLETDLLRNAKSIML